MALSEEKIRKYIQRLLLSRMRILCNHGFYGLLLMAYGIFLNEKLETACTDGIRITFGTDFLDSLTDSELDFVMMHEILHVVLQHCLRGEDRDNETFNIACDIVVNSNILLENKMKIGSITLKNHGESMHLAPDGKEGYEYTARASVWYATKARKEKQFFKRHGCCQRTVQDSKQRTRITNPNGDGTTIPVGVCMRKMLHCVTYGQSVLRTLRRQ